MSWRRVLRKCWYFIWEQNSLASWIVNIILAFILVRFFIYPGLGLLLGTGFPVVAVVSGSMEHDSSFDIWWNSTCNGRVQSMIYKDYAIDYNDFRSFPFRNGFNKGDVMVLRGVDPSSVEPGNVLVYWASRPEPIIHRIISVQNGSYGFSAHNYFYTAKGDHNCQPNPDEVVLPASAVIGKAVFRIPYLGWIKLGAMKLLCKIGLVKGNICNT